MKWESGKKKVSKQKLEALLSTPETRNQYILPKDKFHNTSSESRVFRQSPANKNVSVPTYTKKDDKDEKRMSKYAAQCSQKFIKDKVNRRPESYWEKSEEIGQGLKGNDDKGLFQ